MKNKKTLFAFVLSVWLVAASAVAAQTVGTYDLSHSVIASGGGASNAGQFKVEGTIGQNIAGTTSTGTSGAGNQYNLRGGFWAFQQSSLVVIDVRLDRATQPASISGRIYSGKGKGIISRVRVLLIDTSTGFERVTQSSSDGAYRFEELEVGHFYIVRVESKNFLFSTGSNAFELLKDRADVDFTGERIQPLQ